MKRKVLFTRDSDNKYEVVIDFMRDWKEFDTLIKYLEIHYKTKILLSADGHDARRWLIEINGQSIELIHHALYGNYFLAPTVASEEIVQMIGEDIEKRLNEHKIWYDDKRKTFGWML